MKSIQLFALPDELVSMCVSWIGGFGLKGIALSRQDGSFTRVTGSSRPHDVLSLNPDFILLSMEQLPDPGKQVMAYLAAHPNSVLVELGIQRNDQVQESAVGTPSGSHQMEPILASLYGDIRKNTRAGLWGVTPTGDAVFYEHLRYTAGAESASKRGARLLPVAGSTYFALVHPGGKLAAK